MKTSLLSPSFRANAKRAARNVSNLVLCLLPVVSKEQSGAGLDSSLSRNVKRTRYACKIRETYVLCTSSPNSEPEHAWFIDICTAQTCIFTQFERTSRSTLLSTATPGAASQEAEYFSKCDQNLGAARHSTQPLGRRPACIDATTCNIQLWLHSSEPSHLPGLT